MSYDISFKVKVEGLEDRYIPVGNCDANITWNLREMIVRSTKLEWKNEANNGLCKEVIPYIVDGLSELIKYPKAYKKFEAENGWGTVDGCIRFFTDIIAAWNEFCDDSWTADLADVTYFWIE